MNTRLSLRRRRTARGTHHPSVVNDAFGSWRWRCECGAAGHAGSSMGDWRAMVTSALVHHSSCPHE